MPSELTTGLRYAALSVTLSLLGCGGGEEPQPSSPPPELPEITPPDDPPAESAAASEDAPPDPPAAATDRFPTFGVTLTPPDGWQRESTRPQSGFLGRWLPPDDDPDDWRQFAIDVRPMFGDAVQRAAMETGLLRTLEQAGYQRSEIKLDAVAATRFDAPAPPPGAERTPRPSPVVIAKRAQVLYRALFLLNDPSEAEALEQLAAGWRWVGPDPVAGHLRAGEPVSLFDGLGELMLPEIARIDPEFTRGETAGFTIFDYHHRQDAIIFVCERDLSPEPPTIREHVIGYAEMIEGRTQLDRPLSFAALPSQPNVYASEPLEGRFEEDGEVVSRLCRYAVWRPRGGALVRIQAVINSEVFPAPEQLAEAVAAVDAVLRSCSPLTRVRRD